MIKCGSVTRESTRCRIFTVALVTVLVSACDWVDSTGVQTSGSGDTAIALIEETQKNIEFSIPVSDSEGQSQVRSWDKIDEGALGACSKLINLSRASSTLSQACAPQESNCELIIVENDTDSSSESFATDTNNQSQHNFTIFPPALSSPIGIKYRWEFLDDTGETVTEEVHLCVDATNESPTATADRYVVYEGETELFIEDAQFDENCALDGQNNLLANDADDRHLNGDCLIAEMVQPPEYASNDVTTEFTAGGGFLYIAEDDREHPEDSFTYRVFDGEFYSDETKVTILIASEWTVPDANRDNYNVTRNSEDNVLTPLENDDDPEDTPMTVLSVSQPSAGGEVTIGDDQTLIYTPRTGFRGYDFFSYTIENEYGQQDSALVRVRSR
ncbi:MAG: cadherin-like domain-containing protein [Granulosicoccus sp.]|nr:cadherin-like domain-containing protein [Granulosicoccus sp.]